MVAAPICSSWIYWMKLSSRAYDLFQAFAGGHKLALNLVRFAVERVLDLAQPEPYHDSLPPVQPAEVWPTRGEASRLVLVRPVRRQYRSLVTTRQLGGRSCLGERPVCTARRRRS